jgi:phosphoribosylglycinamide formyltransferase-1
MAKTRVAVLISGSGTNLQALLDAAQDPAYPAQIVLVISNRPDAFGLARAQNAGVKAQTLDHKSFASRADFDAALDHALRAHNIDLVCLAGFMRQLTPGFVDKWTNKLINVHPALLPAFPGLDVQQRAIDAGARFSGCTVHFVTAEMDAGPILVQAVVPILGDDTADSLSDRIRVQEHRAFPLALKLVAEGRVTIENGRALIKDAAACTDCLINPSN